VQVSVGGRLLAAVVTEDRGPLGVHGQRVVRLRAADPVVPGEHFEVEVPWDWVRPGARASERHTGSGQVPSHP